MGVQLVTRTDSTWPTSGTVDNGNGTFTFDATDNGNGTWTNTLTDNGNGTWTS